MVPAHTRANAAQTRALCYIYSFSRFRYLAAGATATKPFVIWNTARTALVRREWGSDGDVGCIYTCWGTQYGVDLVQRCDDDDDVRFFCFVLMLNFSDEQEKPVVGVAARYYRAEGEVFGDIVRVKRVICGLVQRYGYELFGLNGQIFSSKFYHVNLQCKLNCLYYGSVCFQFKLLYFFILKSFIYDNEIYLYFFCL